MTTAVESSWEVFKARLQADGVVFYLPEAACQALQEGELDTVIFGTDQRAWCEHFLYDKLRRIQAGEIGLFQPGLTDPAAGEEIKRRLNALTSAAKRSPSGTYLAFGNSSVVEFLWCIVRVGKYHRGERVAKYRQEDEGLLVAVLHRYSRYAVEQARRAIERVLREGDRANIVRIAELLDIPISGSVREIND